MRKEIKFKNNKGVIKSLVDGSLWFPDLDANYATRTIVRDDYGDVQEFYLKTDNIPKTKVLNDETSLNSEINHAIETLPSPPNGYVKLKLINTNIDEIFAKHNITLKYIEIEDKKYIKSFILANDKRELDCFNIGENELVIFQKESEGILLVRVLEKSGVEVKLFIHKGHVTD